MSAQPAGTAIRQALLTALAMRPELRGVEGIAAPTTPSVLPQIAVEEPQAIDWGTKDIRGRELRTATTLRVARGQALRLPSMVAAVEAVGETLSGDCGGWRIAATVLVRSRSFDSSDGTRSAIVEHRIRVLEL